MTVSTEPLRSVATCSSGPARWRRPVIWGGLGAFVLVGLALNWNWLVAVGALPILIGALPCLAMCALHLCSMRKGGAETSANAAIPPR
jgi:ABC-type proline/glycine betaine transport system permease subunit